MEYKLITEPRYDDIIRHLRDNCFADEPLNKAASLCQRGEGHRDSEQFCYETLKDNFSLMDFQLMKADATGIFSQKILKSNGFKVLSEFYYDKYTDEFGKPLLLVEAPHIKLQLLYKLLESDGLWHRF
ncbi:uncharacterized protein [Eurosta solidaginis]|uniref:uncharacterized protein n=1 Tax=Eurosta solidaginis TaxID=178769 RepID=UPI003530E2A7